MLNKSSRLRAAEVKEIVSHGKSVRMRGIAMKYVQERSFRAAVVVSKSIVRSAVKRNSLRRAVYKELQDLPLPTIWAVFFIQKKPEDIFQLRSNLKELIN